MPEIMTTKEMTAYLKFHEITIRKYAEKGEIPAIWIGGMWRFDKKVIDKWIKKGHKSNPQVSRKGK